MWLSVSWLMYLGWRLKNYGISIILWLLLVRNTLGPPHWARPKIWWFNLNASTQSARNAKVLGLSCSEYTVDVFNATKMYTKKVKIMNSMLDSHIIIFLKEQNHHSACLCQSTGVVKPSSTWRQRQSEEKMGVSTDMWEEDKSTRSPVSLKGP